MLEKYKITQPIAYRIMTNILNSGLYSHAYLFETKGSNDGNTIAIDFAKSIISKTSNENIDKTYFPELKIINSDGMWIKKEQLDELQREFSEKALSGTKKIYIINEAEKLNQYAANSILKFLEEPEDNIIAILVTNNIYQLLETILSRCQVITLINKNNKDIEKIETNITITLLSKYLFNTELEEQNFIEHGKEVLDQIVKFIDYLETNKLNTLLNINELWNKEITDRKTALMAFEIMILYYKDIINKYYDLKLDIFIDYEEEIKKIIEKVNISELLKHLEILIKNKENINKNINLNLLMDKLIIEIGGGI